MEIGWIIVIAVVVGWLLNGLCYWTWDDIFDDADEWFKRHRLPAIARLGAIIPYSFVAVMVIMIFGLLFLLIVGGSIFYCFSAIFKGWKKVAQK